MDKFYCEESSEKVFTIWRVNSEIDGQVWNALVGARDTIGFVFDFFANRDEVGELLAFAVEELPKLVWRIDQLLWG